MLSEGPLIKKAICSGILFLAGLGVMWRNPYMPPETNPNVGDYVLSCPRDYLNTAGELRTQGQIILQATDRRFKEQSGIEDLQAALKNYEQLGEFFKTASFLTESFSLPPDPKTVQADRDREQYCRQMMTEIKKKLS